MDENRNNVQDSGLTCLIMIAAYYGIPVNEESIRYTYNLYDGTADKRDILRIAKHLKLKANNVTIDLEKLVRIILQAMTMDISQRTATFMYILA